MRSVYVPSPPGLPLLRGIEGVHGTFQRPCHITTRYPLPSYVNQLGEAIVAVVRCVPSLGSMLSACELQAGQNWAI